MVNEKEKLKFIIIIYYNINHFTYTKYLCFQINKK